MVGAKNCCIVFTTSTLTFYEFFIWTTPMGFHDIFAVIKFINDGINIGVMFLLNTFIIVTFTVWKCKNLSITFPVHTKMSTQFGFW